MPKSPEEYAHLEWLGYVQPIGLIVSVPAMLEAQCYVNKNISGEHARFLDCLPRATNDEIIPEITDFAAFAQKCLQWEAEDLVKLSDDSCPLSVRDQLTIALPQYNEVLRPTHVVFEFDSPNSPTTENRQPTTPLMLVQQLPTGADFDEPSEADSSRHWHAAPQLKFERLLRETGVPTGLLCNGRQLRLVYAPRGESSGHATFNVDEMLQVAGRPMFAALHMLLSADRMFTLGEKQRLPAILANSRKYQNTVSTKLAEQVLAALYELMRGFQSANDVTGGELLHQYLGSGTARAVRSDDAQTPGGSRRSATIEGPNQVYSGLLRVLMRLVFVLYAEDRDLMSGDPVYSNNYSITGLFERLREDAGRFPDTMDSRFGAWSQLLTLFRLVFEGGQHGDFKLPPRKGYLFDPDRFPFLEGRGKLSVFSSQLSAQTTDNRQLTTTTPRISDGVVYRVLRNLLILDGERLSYRTLDVEQIGSVYETMMGFNLEVAQGQAIAIKPVKSHGAPATINLDELLETNGKDRAKWIKEQTDQKVTGQALKDLKAAESIDDLLAALDKKIAKKVTPRVVLAGSIVLQPSDERRRSGSHYTPRSLTEPIVRTTLEPILAQLLVVRSQLAEEEEKLKKRISKLKTVNRQLTTELRQLQRRLKHAQAAAEKQTPHPSQILDLKICDPAMGSGAFLVEACRQLGDELIKAWYAHDAVPTDIPPDEDEVLYARRLIAQRCLYGVDKNGMAVDLAKLSLWLVTLAKDHAFTFLDHALRHGDSLVGLTREQIIGFHWEVKKQKKFGEDLIQRRLDRATEARAKILGAREDSPYRDQQQQMANADEALDLIRLVGDACVSGFFAGQKKKEREEEVERIYGIASSYLASISGKTLSVDGSQLPAEETPTTDNRQLATGGIDFASRQALQSAADRLEEPPHAIPAFHWEIEFPEVFARENGGFDAFVGNPPFLGGRNISGSMGKTFLDWLFTHFEGASGQTDLCAYFFRRAHGCIRQRGTFGFIATNTIAQGDTRRSGLAYMCNRGIEIVHVRKRMSWPGVAAVVVSVIVGHRGTYRGTKRIDDRIVDRITAFLIDRGKHDDPKELQASCDLAFKGQEPYGKGFQFADDEADATPIAEMNHLVSKDAKNEARISPYLGGAEILRHPQHQHHRFVINFGDMSEEEARGWPDLFAICESKVKVERSTKAKEVAAWPCWRFWRTRGDMRNAIDGLERNLAHPFTSTYLAFAFVPSKTVIASPHVVIALEAFACFCALQSRPHEEWAWLFSSSMKDDLRYAPSDCFDTFPFPDRWATDPSLESAGREYYEYRANLLVNENTGLTAVYNRFHDPHEQSEGILELRRLHGLMDGAVLRAYGWDDLAASARCEFLLDYEEEVDSSQLSVVGEDLTTENRQLTTGNRQPATRRKLPWRLRWPDDFRDEVLARLLELNEQRAMEEKLAGKTAEAQAKKTAGANSRGRKSSKKQEPGLFGSD